MKRVLSLLLALVLTVTLQPVRARAVETLVTSEAGIAMIKEFEGFRDQPYTDNSGRVAISCKHWRKTLGMEISAGFLS